MALQLDRAAHGVDDARIFDEEPVAGRLDHAAAMPRDAGIDQVMPEGLEARDRPLLVSLDEAAVPDHVGAQNGGKPALGAGLLLHAISVPLGRFARRLTKRIVGDKPQREVFGRRATPFLAICLRRSAGRPHPSPRSVRAGSANRGFPGLHRRSGSG